MLKIKIRISLNIIFYSFNVFNSFTISISLFFSKFSIAIIRDKDITVMIILHHTCTPNTIETTILFVESSVATIPTCNFANTILQHEY